MKIENQVIVVTGAGSGIGREISVRFAEAGACIAAVDLNAGTAEETVSMLAGSGHLASEVDVSDGGSVVEMFGKVDATVGSVDGRVPNAGGDRVPGPARDQVVRSGSTVRVRSAQGV